MHRRDFMRIAAATGSVLVASPSFSDSINEGLQKSDLVYLTPLKSNGQESSCQAEIWFVFDGVDIFVCTGTESWRASAPAKGLTTTRFWVGDMGQWQDTNGKYRSLPSILAKASIESDKAEQERALKLFADKYPLSWIVWGPRFRKGLSKGSRTMLRYRPAA